MEKLISDFINKWSVWFMFQKESDELKDAMKRELVEILKEQEKQITEYIIKKYNLEK